MESQRYAGLVAAWGTEVGVAAAAATLGTCQLGVNDRLLVLQLRRGTGCVLSQGCHGFCKADWQNGDKERMQNCVAMSKQWKLSGASDHNRFKRKDTEGH